MAKKIINSFNAGELSPYLYARSDFDKYNSGCLTMDNMIPLPYGGAVSRPAVEYLGETKDGGDARLIPFISSVENSYQLELTDGVIRFWKDGKLISATSESIIESATYKWTESGSGTDEYYLELLAGGDPSILPPNYINKVNLVIDEEALTEGTLGSLEMNQWAYGDNDTLGYNTIYTRMIYEDGVFSENPNDYANGYLTAEYVYQLGTPYSSDDLMGIAKTQSIDVMWLAHPDYPVQRVSRISDTSWTIAEEQFDYPPLLEENDTDIKLSPSGTTGDITIESSQDFFDEGHVGSYFKMVSIRNSDNQNLSGALNATIFTDWINVSGVNWSFVTSGLWAGKVVIQKTTDGGTTIEDYLVVGDTTGADATSARNFSTSSDEPELFNTKIRVHYIESGTSDGKYELKAESIYINSLVKITEYTSETEVSATVISEFQDVPDDYDDYSTLSGTITAGTKAYTGSDFTYSGTTLDLTTIDSGLTDISGCDFADDHFWFVTNGSSNKKIYKVDSALTTLVASYDISTTFPTAVYGIAYYNSFLYVSGNNLTNFFVAKLTTVGVFDSVLVGGLSFSYLSYPSIYYLSPYFYIGEESSSSTAVANIGAYTTAGALTGRQLFTGANGRQEDITEFNGALYVIDSNAKEIDIYSPAFASEGSFDISAQFPSDTPSAACSDGELVYVISNTGDLFEYEIEQTQDKKYYECVQQHSYNSDINNVLEYWSERNPETKQWNEGAFSDYRGHPAAIDLFENRLVYAGTAYRPNTLWLSVIDDYSNFRTGSLDVDSLRLTINSGSLDGIKWINATSFLIIGTSSSEWVLSPASDSLPVTPTSFSIKRKTSYGSNAVQSELIGSSIMFVMRQGRKVRDWPIYLDIDDYVAKDMTILSEHITKGGIKDIAYQQQPDSIVWCIRGDGSLIGLTNEKEQNVVGWHRHTIADGDVTSISILPAEDAEDEIWLTVNKTIDSVEKTYVCRMYNREWGDTLATDWRGSDLYKVYESPASATLFGLDYLEGETVSVVADGVEKSNATVSDGAITIDSNSYTTVVVGLPYTRTLAPMYFNVASSSGSTSGSKVNAHRAVIRFKDTYSAQVGSSLSALYDVKFDPDETPLYNGDEEVVFDNVSEFLKTCYIVQEDQMPIEVLAMIVEVR